MSTRSLISALSHCNYRWTYHRTIQSTRSEVQSVRIKDRYGPRLSKTNRIRPEFIFMNMVVQRIVTRRSRTQLMLVPTLGTVLAAMLATPWSFSIADDDSCLDADASTGTGRSGLTTERAPPVAVMQRVEQLRRVLVVQSDIRVIDSPGGDIGSARAPCPQRDRSDPIVAINVRALEDADIKYPMSADLVIAHELSHILQFSASPVFVAAICSGARQSLKTYELLADFGAGYAMFKLAGPTVNHSFPQTMAALSDYKFTSVKHHGTVTERLNAFDMGLAAAYLHKPLNMDALIRNQDAFLRLLGGPSMPSVESGSTTQLKFTQDALEQIYK